MLAILAGRKTRSSPRILALNKFFRFDDFVSESVGAFDEDRWPDGFGWFSMAIKCTECGQHTAEWISYETM
jgi:hypothetical protein